MTFDEVRAAVLAGANGIHRTWPAQGYRCYYFARDGELWIHHTDGREHVVSAVDQEWFRRMSSNGWVTELVD